MNNIPSEQSTLIWAATIQHPELVKSAAAGRSDSSLRNLWQTYLNLDLIRRTCCFSKLHSYRCLHTSVQMLDDQVIVALLLAASTRCSVQGAVILSGSAGPSSHE